MNLKGEFSILLRGEKDRRTPMKSLNEDIKTGNFKPVYLLYGEEAYLKAIQRPDHESNISGWGYGKLCIL